LGFLPTVIENQNLEETTGEPIGTIQVRNSSSYNNHFYTCRI